MSDDLPGPHPRHRTSPAAIQNRSPRPRRMLAVLAALASLAAASCQAGSPEPPGSGTGGSSPTSPAAGTTATDPVELRFAVFGEPAETESFQRVVDQYNAQTVSSRVTLETFEDRASLLASLEAGDAPDVFLASRRDLDRIVAEGLNDPLLELLDERGVQYDGYSRDALLAFSVDDDLQCMPYGLSPTVVYYNTDLIDFERMRERGLDAPSTSLRSWSIEEFAAAADVATRPRRGTRGVHVPATLRGIAPFVFSGNGQIFDEPEDPTSLALEDSDAQEALTRTLEVVRDPLVTLTSRQLERRSPRAWFVRGRLGMITGPRSLTPRLREVEGLSFDVMPIPALNDQVTIGDISGLCIGADSVDAGRAADFLVRLIGAGAVSQVAREGYLVPANLEVALSPAFLQPGLEPANANIFNLSVRDLRVSELLDTESELSEAVDPSIQDLFTAPVLDDLEQRAEQIDEISRSVLDPDYVPPPPTESPGSTTSAES